MLNLQLIFDDILKLHLEPILLTEFIYLQVQQEKEYEERKEFISNCRLFSGWSSKFKHLLEMSLRKVVYPFDTHIMKQGDPVTGLYFIVR